MSIKLLSIGLLIAILLIPQSMIRTLIEDRQRNQSEAMAEVSASWAAPMELNGPVITVPFAKNIVTDGQVITQKRFAHFLPETLNIDSKVVPETRKRGIYEIIVYTTQLDISGSYSEFDLSAFTNQYESIFWDEAILSIGIPDMRGIQSDARFQLGEKTYRMEPGLPKIPLDMGQRSGINAPIEIDQKAESTAFNLKLSLRGTKELTFNPVGKTTKVSMESPWPHPSFTGWFLPNSKSITDDGFTAEWSVFDLNRNYPQAWVDRAHSIEKSGFGVKLYQPVDNYQQNERSAKYAVLILFLTFISFFFIEVLNKKRIHPVEYVLVGLALTIFYTLLLSLSEVIGFSAAYWVAALIIIAMLTLYALSILRSRKLATFVGSFLTIIYGFLYTILRMEDFSLLVGSFGLLAVLALCMYLSRKVDWYNISKKETISNAHA